MGTVKKAKCIFLFLYYVFDKADMFFYLYVQGVGKNKIADRFLHLLNRPREYLQLHRCVIK